jgi:hypothetical protein
MKAKTPRRDSLQARAIHVLTLKKLNPTIVETQQPIIIRGQIAAKVSE